MVVELPGIAEKIKQGDELEIDGRGGRLLNRSDGKVYDFVPLPDFALEIIEAGGLLKKIAGKRSEEVGR